jgi:hypothetical protein
MLAQRRRILEIHWHKHAQNTHRVDACSGLRELLFELFSGRAFELFRT